MPGTGVATAAAHRLSDPALAALGAGRPDETTLAELRRAQLSRHLLLLRELVKATPVPGYADLVAAERQDPARVRELLSRPLVGVWLARCLTAVRTGSPPDQADLGYLAGLVARAGLAGPAPARGGPAPVQSEPASVQSGPAPGQSQPAPVQSGPTSAQMGPAPAQMGPRIPRQPGADDRERPGRRLSAAHDGLSISVWIEDIDPLRAGLGLTPTPPLTTAELARWQETLTDAWLMLVELARPDAEVLAGVLHSIVPVRPDPAARGISATSADAFGAVAMSEPADAAALAVGLLHETQHSILNAVRYLFDLHDDPDALGYSPWRDDPRPASGILHGAYAYLAVTRFWRARAAATGQRREGSAARADDPLAAFEFARWRSAVLTAVDGLLGGGTLTAAGVRFVSALRAEVLPWLAEPVPPEVDRLAAGANTDHYLRWRLRNRHVDAADVRALVDAWRLGETAPRVESRLRKAPRRALEASTRLDLAHARLRGRSAGGNPPPIHAPEPAAVARAGDLSYVAGDEEAAFSAYRRSLIFDPGDDAAWAGLALTSAGCGLRAAPEVVAAVHRALDDPAVDPVALARWLSS